MKYLELSRNRQAQGDYLLKQFVQQDHAVLFKFKSEEACKNENQEEAYQMLNLSTKLTLSQFWNSTPTTHRTPESDFVIDTYSSFVPNLLLRRLSQRQSVPFEVPELETFFAAVMFTDISGFTNLTEKMSYYGLEGIEKLTRELNQYFDKLISIITNHGGDIIKVILSRTLILPLPLVLY